jgi:hypothetical protein
MSRSRLLEISEQCPEQAGARTRPQHSKKSNERNCASTIRYRDEIFYVVTSLVYDDYPKNASNRFDSFVTTSTNPYNSASWLNPFHFNFTGYDTSPFWDDDGLYSTSSEHTLKKCSREFRWSLRIRRLEQLDHMSIFGMGLERAHLKVPISTRKMGIIISSLPQCRRRNRLRPHGNNGALKEHHWAL